MAVTAKVYTKFYLSAFNGQFTIPAAGATGLKAMLLTSGYSFDTTKQNTHQYKADLTNEASGTGYTTGGQALGTVTCTASGNTVKFDAADTSWPDSTVTGRYLVIYDSTPGSDATRPLICCIDFGADVSTTSGTFQAVWNSSGIFSVTTA